MDKIKEDNQHVYYKFATDVDVGTHINEKGKLRTKWGTKTGYCTFNKQTDELVLDQEKTDAYFFENSRARMLILGKLWRCKQTNEFPDFLEIAAG